MPFLGIEIGGTKLQLVLGDKTSKITDRRRLTVEPSKGAKGIRALIEEALPGIIRHHVLQGVGIGFGGPVDWRSGKISRSHQIEGWSNFNLAGWLKKLTGAPVTVDNDANVAALGEALCGAGVGYEPVFYVTLGSGVGGGLVTNGKIYHGATPGEAEIGHIRLDRNGTTVESRCSGWAVDARVRALIKHQPNSLLAELWKQTHNLPPPRDAHERERKLRRSALSVVRRASTNSSSSARAPQPYGGEGSLLAPALKNGDLIAKRLLNEIAEELAFGLSHAVHLFHPEIIIIGGGLSKLGEPLRAALQNQLRRFLMNAFLPGPAIKISQLAEDAVPFGALALVRTIAAVQRC